MAKKTSVSEHFHMFYGTDDPDAEEFAVLSGHPDGYETIDWQATEPFAQAPRTPIKLVIYKGDKGTGRLPDLCEMPIPVMSKTLLKVLQRAGVDTLVTYPAEIVDQADGTTHTSHVAFQVVGAASLSKRTKTPTHLKLFRRAEKPDELIVERSVKQAIEKAKTPQITFDACDA